MRSAGTLTMTEAERRTISGYIEAEFGIKMPAIKKSLLEGRLAKRVAECGLATYGAYFDFVLRDPRGRDEFLVFEDLVSTHETSFFREVSHFQYLERTAFPELLAQSDRTSLEILSAASSTGEEAYTLAMVLDRVLGARGRLSLPFTVEGVDLSTHAVAIATRGIYLGDRTKTIPTDWKHQYMMASKDRRKNLCRFVPELRRRTVFHKGNLLGSLNLSRPSYDVIFCRNVLIYFDKANQKRALGLLVNHLKPQGYLFLGHSESMLGFDLPVRPVAQAVFQKL